MQTDKKRYYHIFSAAELLFLAFFIVWVCQKPSFSYSFRDYYIESGSEINQVRTEEIAVPKGIYQVTVTYAKDNGGAVCYALAQEAGVHSLYSDRVKLSALQNRKSFDIYVNDQVEALRIAVEPEREGFPIGKISLETAANSKAYQIFSMAAGLLAVNGAAAFLCFRKRKFKRSFEMLGVLAIGFTASLGLLENYILYGHDLAFHLFRIEGLKEGLLAGSFPVKMQPGWFNGWGYPPSVMYGDLLLYFPALLRLVGVRVQDAYKCYIGAVNLATAAIAYYSFYQISQKKTLAVFGSCLYTLFPYRLCCIYVRAAVGEYSAMAFLPLALLGFWYAFEKEGREKITSDKLLAPVIGFSGLLQTHVLTCFLTAFMILLLCLVRIRKVLNKNVMGYLLKIAGITLALNLWFLVPFFHYMGEDLMVTAKADMAPAFQRWGASLAELFSVYWNGTLSVSWGETVTIAQKFPKPAGTGCLIAFFAALLLYNKGKDQALERKIFLCMMFFGLSVAMASNVFPYYKISRIVPWLGRLFAKIQFPYRFLTMAGLFGSLLGVLVLMELFCVYGKKTACLAAAAIGALAMLQGAQFVYSTLYRGDCFLIHDIEAYESNEIFSGEYLYQGSWGPDTEGKQEPVGNGAVTGDFEKRYCTMTLSCKSEQPDAFVLLPQFYYMGYQARDIATGEELTIERSQDNNRIRVNLPEGYEGTFEVSFREPAPWRLAEAFSLAAAVCFAYFYRRLKNTTA